MSNEISTEITKQNPLPDEKEQAKDNFEQRTVPTLVEVQSFCGEFHVKVENAACIRPWLQFSDTHFPEKILKEFEENEFDIPTPIQSIAWPILSQNRDLVGIASSGSGKTLAFILPLIFQLHVDDVRFVINYDYPTSDAVYKHRITRITNCNIAFTFFSNEDAKHAPALIYILDDAGAVVHPILLQIGRKNGFNKWVANVGIPQYPVFENYDNFNGDSPDNWINDEDLPPNLMNIDLSSFDSSQLRPAPVSLQNANGAVNELDVNTRMKNFQDYKQRCQLLERLTWNDNQNNNWNNGGGWSNPDNENQNKVDTSQKNPPIANDYNQWQPPPQPPPETETNPAIIYAKASSEYHVEYNQYTTALQQAMLAQQAGTQITPEQQQYLIAFQQKLQAKQQQLQVMQQAAALTASTQNAWNQQQTSFKPQSSTDPSKATTDAQQAWMQQWMSAGYDASQIAAYQQWYTQMQLAASLAASAAISQPQAPTPIYNGMPVSNK
ncbi:unnamed protein product [Rotaria magnacalcarata]|uniref:RNA helicase n=1 Tax=Rotaria magnacalcarata TaxID=392030 RepID=A0A8S2QI48_9BILA|nr:unnamed protein product [Rotaria magnacalcarata]CAF4151711.1 unnamed protein product [Rotaria magnacalcarata]